MKNVLIIDCCDEKGYPTIGDQVWIGTGTVIVGNIKIGQKTQNIKTNDQETLLNNII